MHSSPSADHMNVMAQAEKDIDYVSERLARSVFERRAVAEDRLLMRKIGTSPRELFEFSELWNMCDLDLRDILGCLVHALHSAQEEAGRRGDESYFDHWWAAWVSSPVSTRLLRAMQTLVDGSIFQVREDLLHCIFQYTASQIACTAEQAELYYPGVTPGITVLGVP